MAKLSQAVEFISASSVRLSASATKFIESELGAMRQSSAQTRWVAVVSLGIDGPWLGFDALDDIPLAATSKLENWILFSIPIHLEESEKLNIDYDGERLQITNIDIQELIPDELRSAFAKASQDMSRRKK